VTGAPISVVALIGIILLIGIVKKNWSTSRSMPSVLAG
jgi:hypothetical protein